MVNKRRGAQRLVVEDEHEIEKEVVWVGEWLQERPRCLLPSLTFPSPTIPSSPSQRSPLAFLSSLFAFNYFASRRGEQRVRLAIHSTSCFVSTLDEGSLVKTFFLNVGVSSLSSLFFLSSFFQKKKNLPNIFLIIIFRPIYFFSPESFSKSISSDIERIALFEIIYITIIVISLSRKVEKRRFTEILEFARVRCGTPSRRCSKLIRFRDNKFVLQSIEAD